MFMGLNLNLQEQFFEGEKGLEEYVEIWKDNFKSNEEKWKKNLKEYILNKTIDGSKLQEDWFPEINADIFISHSHQDEKLAQALAGWLYDIFGIKSFIDSDRWGYIDELLEQLNDEYSDKDELMGYRIYNYKKANGVSQNVNTMLTIALHKMIDKTEVILLLNTDNSVKGIKDIDGITYSPWIYSEMVCSDIVRKKPLLAYRDYKSNKVVYEDGTKIFNIAYAMMVISYTMPIAHLRRINEAILDDWVKEYKGLRKEDLAKKKLLMGDLNIKNDLMDNEYPLDILYRLLGIKAVQDSRQFFEYIPQNIIKQIYEKEFDSNINDQREVEWERVKMEQRHIFEGIYENRFCCTYHEGREDCRRFKECRKCEWYDDRILIRN